MQGDHLSYLIAEIYAFFHMAKNAILNNNPKLLKATLMPK
jgi:hypothetical protein